MSPHLVAVTRLSVRFSSDKSHYFQSTSTLAQTAQPIKTYTTQNVQWEREYKHLGGGTFGQVYLERCMEAGRTEERRAVKKIRKIRSIDYERELEVLALLSYRKKVHPLSCHRLTTLTDPRRSTEISL
jgi:hypothetical protein